MEESILIPSGLKVLIQSELVISETMLHNADQHIHATEIEKREQVQAKGQVTSDSHKESTSESTFDLLDQWDTWLH